MNDKDRENSNARFGTFGGVFTPCTLTILGVIMFLRLGNVVSHTGVWLALSVVVVANLITFLTTISLSAIATNTRVQGGGAYFLISRSLGVEFGGAIGIVFFLAQAISVSLYVIGFSEAVVQTFPGSNLTMFEVATGVNFIVFLMVWIGASWTIKLQYVILAVLVASLGSFCIGAFQMFDLQLLATNAAAQFGQGENWFTMFALFFPAVTGIMAGANMSGDLKNPAYSIPLGTFSAILVTFIIYALMVVLLGATQPVESLRRTDSMVMTQVSSVPWLIVAGVMAATLSSALGSMIGAPRILQALARDNIFPAIRFFGAGSGELNEPRRAIVLTFVIAQVFISFGDLNSVAPIITMAFMITYGTLNLATFYEYITKNPSFRPRFRYGNWMTALLGTLGCLVVMFLLHPLSALIAILIMVLLHWYISRKEVEARWGDLQSGLVFERARSNLLKLEDFLYHPKNWRPIILAFSGGGGWTRPNLANYGHWFTSGHGILSLGQVIQGDVEEQLDRLTSQERLLHNFIASENLEAFPAVVVAPTVNKGIETLVQCHGLGGLRPNTVLLRWPDSSEKASAFSSTLRVLVGLKRSIVAIRFFSEYDDEPFQIPKGTIDVWWRGEKNGGLMLLLAHLLTKNDGWRDHKIRLIRVIKSQAGKDDVLKHLNSLIERARIRATPMVVVSDDIGSTIQRISCLSSIVFIGFDAPDEGMEHEFVNRLDELVETLPRVVFVDSSGDASLEI